MERTKRTKRRNMVSMNLHDRFCNSCDEELPEGTPHLQIPCNSIICGEVARLCRRCAMGGILEMAKIDIRRTSQDG